MPALVLVSSLVLLAPFSGEGRLDDSRDRVVSVFKEDVYGKSGPESHADALRRVEDADPEERPAAILKLALSGHPGARSWLVALARSDGFARSWLGEVPGERSVAAARLGLGILGGRAAEGELAELLCEASGEGRFARLATLSGLAALRSGAGAGETGQLAGEPRISDASLRRAALSRGLAIELRELAAALAAQRTRTPLGTALSELVAARDFSEWEECGRRARLDSDPARARFGRAVEAWLQDEGAGRSRGADAMLASAARPGPSSPAQTRRGGPRGLNRRTEGLLFSLVHCVPEAADLIEDLNRALIAP